MGTKQAKVDFKANTSELNQEIKKSESQLKTFRSELKLNETQLKGTGDSSDLLQQRLNILSDELTEAKNKTALVEEKLTKAKEVFGDNSEEVNALTRQLNSCKTVETSIQNEIEKTNTQIEGQSRSWAANEQAIAQADQELEGLGKELELNSAQMENAKNKTELLKERNELLGKQFEVSSEKVEELENALETCGEECGENSDEYRELKTRLVEAKTQQASIQSEINKTTKTLKEQKNSLEQAGRQIKEYGEGIKKVGEKVSDVGEKMLVVTGAVTATGTAAVKTAASFESSMSQVQATMGITKDAMSEVDGQTVNTMDTLSDLAKEMGATTAFSATECAEALNYLALAGYDTQQMCDTLPIVLNLAAAGNFDLATASDMVTDAMSALGMETSEAGVMVDQMAKTASSTNTSVEQLGEGILKIGATAKSIKGGTAELNTALGILANNGVKGAEGGTHLRNVILSLQSPTDEAAKRLDKLGLSVYDSSGEMRSLNDILGNLNTSMDGMTSAERDNIISAIFNKTDLASVNALLANTGDTWDSLQQSITESGGAAQQMADTQLDNLEGQITILKSALEGLAITFGDILLPTISGIVDKVSELVNWFSELDPGIQETIVKVALVAAAIGPALIIIGKVISAVGTIIMVTGGLVSGLGTVIGVVGTVVAAIGGFVASVGALPILIAVGIAALVALFVANFDTIKQFVSDLWENIKETFGKIIESIKGAFESAAAAVSEVFETIGNIITVGIMLIGEILSAAFQIITLPFRFIWENCKEYIIDAWETITQAVSTALDFIKTIISNIWNGIVAFLSPILESIKTTVINIWDAISAGITTAIDTIESVITTVWNAVSSFILTVMNTIGTTISDIWNGIKTTISNVVDGVKTKVTNVFNVVKEAISTPLNAAKETVSDIFNSIKEGISDKIDAAKEAVSSAIEKIKGFFDFSWGLPELKMPTISITGKFSLDPPSVPKFSIKWNKDGIILTRPTIFGESGGVLQGGGEAGMEAVLPIEKLQGFFDNAIERAANLQISTDILFKAVYWLQVIANKDNNLYIDGRRMSEVTAGDYDEVNGTRLALRERGLAM